LDGFAVTKAEPEYAIDLALSQPLSKAFLEGRVSMPGVSVLERPDIHRRVETDYLEPKK
jgi:hypothetical protein